MKRKIKKVYQIELERGLQKETLKIVSNKKLADNYIEKYTAKYPYNNILCNIVDYVEN